LKDLNKNFYIYTLEGEMLLVEIVELGEGISVIIGDKRLDLEMESALDLADTLIQKVNEVQFSE
tara:strand:+ start:1318 stop:1509 length:192 start_codon:yes stop_codon:yes gene_type:complete